MGPKFVDKEFWDGHRSRSVILGRPFDKPLPGDACYRLLNSNSRGVQIDIAATEGDRFSVSQPAVAQSENHDLEPAGLGRKCVHHATGHTVIIGGKSPQWVNNSVKLLLNSALAYIGLLIGLPAAGLGIFDRAVEDVILAWQRFTNTKRKQSMGSHSYRQTYAPGDAWSLSGLQGGRVALHEKRGYISFTAGVIDSVPYRIGQDVDLGHRCGFEIGKRIWLSYVVKKRRKWSRTQPPIWEITIGDSREDELPGSSALRLIETLHAESTRYQNLI